MISLKLALYAGAAAIVAFYSFQAGNQFGTYAREYHKIVRELEKKNAELAAQKKEDEAAIAAATHALDNAVAAAKDVKTCKATKDVARKINAVKE